MPIKVSIDPAANLVTFNVTGDNSAFEYLSAFLKQFELQEFEDGMADLWIFDNVTFDLFDKNNVQQNVNRERENGYLSKISKAAWVCPKDIEFGTMRQFEIMNEDPTSETDRKVRVFRNVDNAFEWLNGIDTLHANKTSNIESPRRNL